MIGHSAEDAAEGRTITTATEEGHREISGEFLPMTAAREPGRDFNSMPI